MIERIPDLVNADADLVRRGRHLSTTFMLERRRPGLPRQDRRGPRRFGVARAVRDAELQLRAARAARRVGEILEQRAAAGLQRHLCAVQARQAGHRGRPASADGEPALLQGRAGHAAPGGEGERSGAVPSPLRPSPQFEPIVGRYLNLDLLGRPHRLYVEEAGQGIPLLCLHTAGSDGRQYRGLLNDARITKNYRVIVFDMPWHGKSSPPEGYQPRSIASPRATTSG